MAVEDFVLVVPPTPTAKDDSTAVELEIFKLRLKDWYNRTQAHENFLAWLYSVVMGQRTPSLTAVILSHTNYAAARNNGLLLIRIIKSLTHTFEPDNENLASAL